MKRLGNPALWRGLAGRRWKLADFLISTAEEIRNANKAADMSFPIARALDLVSIAREYQMEWLEKELKKDVRDRGRWPHL